MADDEIRSSSKAHRFHFLFNLHQQSNVLFHASPASKPRTWSRSSGARFAFRARKVRHPRRAASGDTCDQCCIRQCIAPDWERTAPLPLSKTWPRRPRVRSSMVCSVTRLCFGSSFTNQSAAGKVFVYVGVPACGKRQLHFVRPGALRGAHLAGACNVQQVGLEAIEDFADKRKVAQKKPDHGARLFPVQTTENCAAARGSIQSSSTSAWARSPAPMHEKAGRAGVRRPQVAAGVCQTR